jgi:hypothetical protein
MRTARKRKCAVLSRNRSARSDSTEESIRILSAKPRRDPSRIVKSSYSLATILLTFGSKDRGAFGNFVKENSDRPRTRREAMNDRAAMLKRFEAFLEEDEKPSTPEGPTMAARQAPIAFWREMRRVRRLRGVRRPGRSRCRPARLA